MSDLRKKSAGRALHGRKMQFSILALFTVLTALLSSSSLSAQSGPVPPAAPTNLVCTVEVAHVNLEWANTGQYDQVILRRNGVMLVILEGTATSYVDMDVPANFHPVSYTHLTLPTNREV